MPEFLFTDPQGQQHRITGPEGATKEQAFTKLQQQLSTGQAQPGKIPPQEPMGMGEQFAAGLEKGMAGYPQAIANIAKSPEEAEKINQAIQARDIQVQQRGGLGVPGAIGQMVAQAPAMAAGGAIGTAIGGPAGAIAGGAIGGGLAGMTQPVTAPNYWQQKPQDIFMGMATGAGTAGAVKTIGAALNPMLPEAQKWLVSQGVKLTPGQLTGGILRRAEEAFKSLPILGSFIRGAEGRGIEGFNRAIANQVLEPIGDKLITKESGPALVKELQGKLDTAYDTLLPQMKLGFDHDMSQSLGQIRVDAGQLPEAMEKQFNSIVDRTLMPMLQSGQQIPGDAVKLIDRRFRDFARDFKAKGAKNADPDARMMGDLFDQARTAIRDGLGRQNPPELVARLRNIDQSYAMLTRVEGAAARRVGSGGTFTPADLLQTIKSQDKSFRKRSFAAGDALMQVYANYGQKVLPGKMPDSGTTERALYDSAILAAGYGAHTGVASPAVLGGLLAGSVPYTRPGMAAINAAAAAERPAAVKAAGSVIRKVAPFTGPLGAEAGKEADEPEYGGPQQ